MSVAPATPSEVDTSSTCREPWVSDAFDCSEVEIARGCVLRRRDAVAPFSYGIANGRIWDSLCGVSLNLPGRVILFAGAALLVLLVAGWRAAVAWQETNRLQNAFHEGQQESLAIADHFKAQVLEMNHSLIRFGLNGSSEDRQDFEANVHELRRWLASQTEVAEHPATKTLLTEIAGSFTEYLEDAQRLLRAQAASPAGIAPTQLLDKVEGDSRTLLKFSPDLDFLAREAMASFVQDLDDSVRILHRFTVWTLGALFILIVLLGFFVWRDLIAPMQARLSESWQRLEHQEKLSSLGALAAGVAHEIRNPLTSMKARAFTLTRLLPPKSAEHEDACVINSEIIRLERIVNDFLAFSKPPEPRPVPMDVSELVEQAVRLLEPDAKARHIDVVVRLQNSVVAPADSPQLKQVVLNLLRNAADACSGATDPTIEVVVASDYGRLDGRQTPVVRLEVTDNGPGIPTEVQRRVFDPFFTTKAKGTGLGLTIAARIIEAHGGILRFSTAPGRGTTFTVLLPLYPPNPDAPSSAVVQIEPSLTSF